MTGGDLALVVAVVLCALAFAAVVLVLARIVQVLRELLDAVGEVQDAAERFTAETGPLVGELRASVAAARTDLARFDAVLGSAEAIATNVEGASRVARAALSRPVIKTVALASGTQRAARQLRRPPRRPAGG